VLSCFTPSPIDGRLAAAYNNRGNVYRHRLDLAIADHDAAIGLRATAQCLYNRAKAYRMKGGYPRALADDHVAIRLVQGFLRGGDPMFRQVTAECRRAVVEWESAQAELGVVRTGP
jgi:hypothetical protein